MASSPRRHRSFLLCTAAACAVGLAGCSGEERSGSAGEPPGLTGVTTEPEARLEPWGPAREVKGLTLTPVAVDAPELCDFYQAFPCLDVTIHIEEMDPVPAADRDVTVWMSCRLADGTSSFGWGSSISEYLGRDGNVRKEQFQPGWVNVQQPATANTPPRCEEARIRFLIDPSETDRSFHPLTDTAAPSHDGEWMIPPERLRQFNDLVTQPGYGGDAPNTTTATG